MRATLRRGASRLLISTTMVLGASCADETGADRETDPGRQLSVTVAPLDLPGLSDVCYGLEARNGLGEPVWARTELCSTRFGNGPGGDIAYVGPCDASEPEHTVTLTVESLRGADGALLPASDWENPCPAGAGCAVSAFCLENADTPVSFNLTIMRRAQQGFFDMMVNFESVYCSGKIDCAHPDGSPIELLHNRQGQRDQTVVVALACTGGPGDAGDTRIHMGDVRIVCGEGDGPLSFRGELMPNTSACFQNGDTRVYGGFAELIYAAAPSTAPQQLTEIYARLLSHNALATAGGWDPDAVSFTGIPTGFDTAFVLERLAPDAALVGLVEHTPDFAPTGPLDGIERLRLGVARWDGPTTSWEVSQVLAIPTNSEVVQALIAFPHRYDGANLGVLLIGLDALGDVVQELVIYTWDSPGQAFGPGTTITPPAPNNPQGGLMGGDFTGPRDGHVLWYSPEDANPFEIHGPLIGSAETGWQLVPLAVPAGDYIIPAGQVYEGYVIPPVQGEVFIEEAQLLPGGKVALRTYAHPPDDPADLFPVVVQFSPVPGQPGQWSFGLHPVYANYDARFGPFAAPFPRPSSDGSGFNVGGLKVYRNHHLATLTSQAPKRMGYIFEETAAGLRIWNRFDGFGGTNGDDINALSVTDVIERPGQPALALYQFWVQGQGDAIALELGVLDEDGASSAHERVVTPYVKLAGQGFPGTPPGATAYDLQAVERGAKSLLLFFRAYDNAGQWIGDPVWRVDESGANVTATLVAFTSAELSDVDHMRGGAFSQGMSDTNPGDDTLHAVPGACDGVAGFVGDGTSWYHAEGGSTYLDPVGSPAAGDFSLAATSYSLDVIGYGQAIDAIIAGMDAELDDLASGSGGVEDYVRWLAASATEGNQLSAAGVDPADPVFQHAVYAGTEALDCDGVSCGKIYYNTAIGFDALLPDCWLLFEATASGSGTVGPDGVIAPGAVYPVLSGAVQLTGPDVDGGLICGQHPLGSDDFPILYTEPDMSGIGFCYTWDGENLVEHFDEGCDNSLGILIHGR